MSTNRLYDYEPYTTVDYAQYTNLPDKPVIRKVKTKARPKKINFVKVIVSLVMIVLVCFPLSVKTYDFLFLNKIRNSKLDINAENIVNQSQKPFANSMLMGRYYMSKVETKHPDMASLKLNKEMSVLTQNLQYIVNQYPRLHPEIFIWDYQTGNYVNINGEEKIPAASIIKVPVLVQMFKRIESGDLDLYEKFKMTHYYRTGGSGYLQYRPDGMEFELFPLAQFMIRTSDNTATNMIISAIGGTHELNMAIRNWGLANTHVENWLPDLYGGNYTTPKDMATILYNADNPEFLSLENRSRIVEIMSRVKNTSLLKQGIPDSAQLIHKTGDIGEMLGDVGVVTMPNGRRYIIAVMVKRNWNDYSARTLVNSVSSTTYNSFAANNL